VLIEYLGWSATAVFVASYLCKRAEALRRVQMLGALMWVVYGLLIKATPVVAANLLVFGVAGWTLLALPKVPAFARSKIGALRRGLAEACREDPGATSEGGPKLPKLG
jgi:hypothetical protein